MSTEPEKNPVEEAGKGLGGIFGSIQQKAGEIAGGVKDKIEGVVGAENLKKVTDTLNTDVGAMAKDAAGKATDAVENLVGRDLNNDGTIGGKPVEPTEEPAAPKE